MKLPNIYEGNYSRLIILPVALFIISLIIVLYLSPIKYGIDLRGGTLITLQLTGPLDEIAAKDALSVVGQGSILISKYRNPVGDVAEIEMSTDERIKMIDTNLELFDAKMKETEQVEIDLANLRSQYNTEQKQETADKINQTQADYEKKIDELRAIGKEIEASANSIGVTDKMGEARDAKVLKSEITGISLEAKDKYKSNIMNALAGVTKYSSYSVEEISPTLSNFFIGKVVNMAIISAILAIVVIFLIFRTLVPSLAVISGAVSDITIALGAMGLFGVPLTLSSFAALMMLVGLSLDTDMMLTIKTIKRGEGTAKERAYSAFSTGIAMTSTTLAGFGALFILGVITRIPAYYQIGFVGVAGLIGDLIATWCSNGVLVLWYLEGKLPKFLGKPNK